MEERFHGPNRGRRHAVGRLVMPLSRLGRGHLTRAGPKAVALGRAKQAGLPVPDGFVLTSEAFRLFLAVAPGWDAVEAALQQASPLDLPGAELLSHRAQRALRDVPMPPAVEQALRDALSAYPQVTRWAVRSSATTEDLPTASFAGQHDTFVNVPPEDVSRRVRDCWRSLYGRRAILYRANANVPAGRAAMAVIVQQMVPAELAGVVFTSDPASHNRGRIVMEAAVGIGESVVSGAVAPCRVVLEKSTLRLVEASTQGAVVLDEQTARRVAALALDAERVLAGPLDVEWAISGGAPYLLQLRPMTGKSTGKSWEERQVWTNANAGEAMPGVVTPMTYSVVHPFMQALSDSVVSGVGLRIPAYMLVRQIAGRVYFNVNTPTAVMRLVPGGNPEHLAMIFGGRQDRGERLHLTQADLPDLRIDPWLALRSFPRLVWAFLRPFPSAGRPAVARVRRLTEQLERMARSACDDASLVRAAAMGVDTKSDGGAGIFRMILIAGVHIAVLYALCARWFGEEGTSIAGRLMRGLGTLDEAEAGRDLWRIAEEVGSDEGLREAVMGGGTAAEVERRLATVSGGSKLLERWVGFMARHGHHTRGELELANPRWREEPDQVLALLRRYVQIAADGGAPPAASASEAAVHREALAAECMARLASPAKRVVFRWVLRRAWVGVAAKENLRTETVRRTSCVRLLMLEIGRRMAERGLCDRADDVFFLTVQELCPELLSDSSFGARRAISARRAEHVRNQSLLAPPVVVGSGDPGEWLPEPKIEGGGQMRGLPASPGVATGRARVIVEPCGDDCVLCGEILVAPSTDPGWSPYFLPAAGLVVDLGGMLSHGAIIAREYGIPAVINVGPATKAIRTGDLVQVDGDRGLVTILSRASA